MCTLCADAIRIPHLAGHQLSRIELHRTPRTRTAITASSWTDASTRLHRHSHGRSALQTTPKPARDWTFPSVYFCDCTASRARAMCAHGAREHTSIRRHV